MIILGIDPGYERMGVAILEKSGSEEKLLFSDCVKTSSSLDFPDRLLLLGRELNKLMKKWKPQVVAVEKVFFTNNQKTVMKVAEVRGMIIYLASSKGIEIKEFTPLEIKIALTGYGKADKKQVEEMVKTILNLPADKAGIEKRTRYDDEFDAIATALTCSASAKSIR